MAAFIGVIMAGGFAQAAEGTVSTVDSQELFRSRMVSDDKRVEKKPDLGQAVDDAVSNLPRLNSRLRWAAVKTPVELAEEQKAVQRQTKAIPIIITAADIDKERKAKKKEAKADTPAIISPRPLQAPQITPAPIQTPERKVAPQPVQRNVPQEPSLDANVRELPPIQPVGGVAVSGMTTQEVVELPPVTAVEQPAVPLETIMDAIVESTSIELEIHDVGDDSVALPAIRPVN